MRWKFLLKPGWLALTVVVLVFAALCFTVLAPWQFDRHEERTARNNAVSSSTAASPQPLAELLPGNSAPDGDTEWRRAVIEGTYLPDDEVIARLRTVQGEPAFEVLTPLRTTGGPIVLINRGFVRPANDTGVPDFAAPPQGRVTVEARVRIDENDPSNRDAFADETTGGRLHSYSVDSQVVARATGLDIKPGYYQLEPGEPGVLTALPLPQLEAGPYFSYALQWIAFGAMALLGWLYFTIREARPGGALADSAEAASGDAAEPTTAESAGTSAGQQQQGKHPGKQKRKSVAQILAEDDEADALR
ncbi:cytochrome oxidase assembly protein ShyY1 [Prauserella sediminis]|uniref:SURF1-like protein n=1 Tax=Prauserella sediminis TaxID=577680 RepID=A0A839XPD8_9PSEU|nr:SURF1 family cytochrome oxidase biogenesis protein [Prauserella sediminis]MBB3661795.1 cytochrome oxidase assembly protein ShyY1 [Prauserella sediminis]